MTVTDLIASLAARFPRAPIQAWAANYRSALGHREGEDLAFAFRVTLDTWTESMAPKPAHIAEHLPQREAVRLPQAPHEDRDVKRRARYRELVAMWTKLLAQWFAMAKAEGWAGHLEAHLRNLADATAYAETMLGRDHMAALAWANGRDKRGNHPLRAPDDVVDERDASIFRARADAQARVTKAGRRGPHFAQAWARDRMRTRIIDAIEGKRDIPAEKQEAA